MFFIEKSKQTDVIFTYLSNFSGHKSTAESISNAIKELDPNIVIKYIDSTYAYPTLSAVISQFYLELITKTPQIWDFVYNNPDVKKATKEIRELFNIMISPKLSKILNEYNPKVIVATHALPANIIAYYKKQYKLNKPLIGVITDYGIHSYWFNNEIDLYMVATKEIYDELVKNDIPTERIKITGIPVNPSFLNPIDKNFGKKYFGMNPRMFTIMIIGGSQGLIPVIEIMKYLSNLHLPIQYLIITGKNKNLFRELKKNYKDKKNLYIFGYIKNINIAMDASDLIITKAGGITITESITKKLPMIIVQPLPGQEKVNTKFLIKNKLAIVCEKISDLQDIIYSLYNNPKRLIIYRNRLSHFAKPYAAYECAEYVINFIKRCSNL
jgi:processive 1,2-diacylglycerol beta-glucosyltransferase